MNVLVLSRGQDTGGQGVRIKQAFDRHGGPDWRVRSVHRMPSFFRYAHDADWEQLDELYAWADLVHYKSGNLLPILDGGKPVVIHHQGTWLRDNPEVAAADAARIGAANVVSTVDLLLRCPGARWLPYPADTDWLASYRNPLGLGPGRPFVIAHAPTNRAVKGTQTVIAAVELLRTQGYNVELDLIESLAWKPCLSRKGRAHAFVDQLHLGYGINAVEAWAMGLPVICGVDDEQVVDLMRSTWGHLPFLRAAADPVHLAARLALLIEDAGERMAWAEIGRDHIERYHHERVVVEQLKEIWTEAATPHVEPTDEDEEERDGAA